MIKIVIETSKNTNAPEAFASKVVDFLVEMQKQNPVQSTLNRKVIEHLVHNHKIKNKCFFLAKSDVSRPGETAEVGDTGDRVIGCVCAYLTPGKAYGSFGFYEIDMQLETSQAEAVSEVLLKEAQVYLKELACHSVRGPIDYNIWLQYRLKTSGFDRNFSWEPNHPREYAGFLEKNGFKPKHKFSSEFIEANKLSNERHKKDYESALVGGYQFKKFSDVDIFGNYLESLYELSISSFKDSSELYEDLSYEDFMAVYVPVFKRANLDYAVICLDSDNKMAGFLYAFKDRLQDTGQARSVGVMKTVAIKDEHRGKGLSNALYYMIAEKFKEDGVVVICNALIKEGALSFSYARGDEKQINEYAVFSKEI